MQQDRARELTDQIMNRITLPNTYRVVLMDEDENDQGGFSIANLTNQIFDVLDKFKEGKPEHDNFVVRITNGKPKFINARDLAHACELAVQKYGEVSSIMSLSSWLDSLRDGDGERK